MNERAKHDADAGPREEPGSSRHLDWAHEVDSQKAQQGHRRGDHPVVAEEARGEITDAAQSFSTESIRGRTHEEPAGCGGTSSRDEQGVQHDANTGRSNGLPTPTL